MVFKPGVVVVVQGTPEWDALYQAMGQYVENQGEYVDGLEPGEDLEGEVNLKHAQSVMGQMDSAYARLADVLEPWRIPERIG
jgi:hypothetical protein